MADVQAGEHSLITSKWGPLPVWAWSLIGLALAWLYAKYRSGQQAKQAQQQQDSTGSGTDAQSQDVAPQFIIENNMPGVGAPTTPSAPVTAPTPPSTPTPPGKTPNPPTTGKPKPPPKKKPPTPKEPTQYKVKHGDTLSSIAARHKNPKTGKPYTWQQLWEYNTTPGNRPASTIATLKKRGPNLLYANETILIPQ
ncbi:MAG: LysM peptidoglycan-binding domain-containing protein [Streptomyces sp.]|nr:LysM peptidoglycan-binding domain-containing protein [Streptomyces sp.]